MAETYQRIRTESVGKHHPFPVGIKFVILCLEITNLFGPQPFVVCSRFIPLTNQFVL